MTPLSILIKKRHKYVIYCETNVKLLVEFLKYN